MPFCDDLIERTIEQLSQILSRMLLHQVSPVELETFVQTTYQKYTGIDGTLLRQLSSQDILNTLNTTGQLDKDKAYLIAALLEAESSVTSDNVDLKLKALDLYLEAALDNAGMDDIHQHIEKIIHELNDFILPEATEWRLFNYEVLKQHFARAENRLFDLKRRLGDEAVKPKVLEFYTLLQNTSDEDLEKGGLTREEVEGQLVFHGALDPVCFLGATDPLEKSPQTAVLLRLTGEVKGGKLGYEIIPPEQFSLE
jgi:hypothetical protein